MTEMSISGLRIYPIKSFGGVELTESWVEKRGLLHDRRWMLVDEDGVFMTQRSDTRLALFRLKIGTSALYLSGPNPENVLIPFEPCGEPRTVQVWKSICEAVQVSPRLDEWFSDLLGQRCSLVYMPEGTRRETNPEFTQPGDIVGFADAYPVLVAGEASLADLNQRLESPLPMNRFRPNLIVKGSTSFAEDDWPSFQIGDIRFRAAKTCARCAVTATDQDTGEVGVEPLRTLAKFRLKDQKVLFGAYFVPESEGLIRICDSLQIS